MVVFSLLILTTNSVSIFKAEFLGNYMYTVIPSPISMQPICLLPQDSLILGHYTLPYEKAANSVFVHWNYSFLHHLTCLGQTKEAYVMHEGYHVIFISIRGVQCS